MLRRRRGLVLLVCLEVASLACDALIFGFLGLSCASDPVLAATDEPGSLAKEYLGDGAGNSFSIAVRPAGHSGLGHWLA